MGDIILMVAEDGALIRQVGVYLSTWGHAPHTAHSAGEALEFISARKPPLVIIDNALAGSDALGILRGIKKDHPWVQVIFLVALDRLERGAKSLELGASDFLAKPVTPNRLAIALKRAQERLIINTKLAVLSGQALKGAPAPQVESVFKELDENEAAAMLYDSQQIYRQLFDEVPCYISVLNRDFRITDVNRRFRVEFGDLVGQYCHDVYQGRCETCPDCPVADTFVDGQSHQYEQILTSLTGEQYNVLTWTAPLRDGQGEINHVLEMSTNITQIRKLQDHLASLGMVIGSISHGVKGLLTALDGGMYSVRSGIKRDDQDRVVRGWEVVELMVGRIKRTVLDVLHYAKDRGVELEEVDMADFARQVALTGEYAAKKHDIIFSSEIKGGLGKMAVDPNALNPALVNLLENAVDACLGDKSGGPHEIRFKASREDDVMVFDVEDNGLGMDEATKENMFTLFFTSKGSGGTGLGLFIANDTVQQHGGSITVDSEPGQGTHFHVRIPVAPKVDFVKTGGPGEG